MKHTRKWTAFVMACVMALALLAGCATSNPPADSNPPSEPQDEQQAVPQIPEDTLLIADQGMFSSGGTGTDPLPGTFDETTNWLDRQGPETPPMWTMPMYSIRFLKTAAGIPSFTSTATASPVWAG